MTAREEFLEAVRSALGRTADAPPAVPSEATSFSQDAPSVEARARSVRQVAEAQAVELMSQLEESSGGVGWKVARVESPQEAALYVAGLARELEARTIVRSTHPVLDRLDLEGALSGTGIEVGVMAIDGATDGSRRDEERQSMREKAIAADIGVTGVDHAIAETGTCVLVSGKGVSRLVSLLPPVHVAVVELGQVLPSLDELFTLRRQDFLSGNLSSYVNLISGPSRSADIEYTLVTGVHGPGEVHMVLIG